mmetsp:Transcript_15724/g.29801  ORF Transcript_15724/g.29801 Transcript_15724/m.29801 type:complete len:214 (-) Transcript_15724:108-749(-)
MSSELADVAPKEAGHSRSKKELEVYLQGLELDCYSIRRPSSFFENFDDPSVYHPLCRGSLKNLYKGWVQVNYVATADVGKATVLTAQNPCEWNGKTLACITCRDTGEELTKVFSKVSGISCTYTAAPLQFILRQLLTDLYHMVVLRRATSAGSWWSEEIRAFRKVLPNAVDFEQLLRTQQTGWSDRMVPNFAIQHPPRQLVLRHFYYYWVQSL